MKKNDCSIIQDLMPLVLDRVASAESREAVEDHIAHCETCGKQYNDMKASLPAPARMEYEQEQQRLVGALKTVRKARLKRRILALALAVVLCAAAAFAGMLVHDRLVNSYSVAVDNSLYSLSLAQLKDGRIVITGHAQGINFDTGTASEEFLVDGKHIVYVYYTTSPIHSANAPSPREWNSVLMLLGNDGSQEISEIRQGKPDDYMTVWTQGEAIPSASEKMENYFRLEAQWAAWFEALPSSDDGKVFVDPTTYNAKERQLTEARQAVPEWQ